MEGRKSDEFKFSGLDICNDLGNANMCSIIMRK